MNIPDSNYYVVGLGGVGSIVARYLACFLNATGQVVPLTLIDGDSYEPKNAERQIFQEFGPKAAVQADSIRGFLAPGGLMVEHLESYVLPDNIKDIIPEDSVVFLCVDHHGIRRLFSEHFESLSGGLLISGGNEGVEEPSGGTYGNIQVHVRQGGVNVTPTIASLHPEISEACPRKAEKALTDCTAALLSSPQILFANLAVASHMLNAFWSICASRLSYGECVFDISLGMARPQIELEEPCGYRPVADQPSAEGAGSLRP